METTKKRKLTKVQQDVMARFDRGERLAFFPTNRQSGEAIFWLRQYQDGNWAVVEKALYPQLRVLFWDGIISSENSQQVVRPDEVAVEPCWELHYAGCIGF